MKGVPLGFVLVTALALCVWRSSATAAQRATAACDGECLRGKVTQLPYALAKHVVGAPQGFNRIVLVGQRIDAAE